MTSNNVIHLPAEHLKIGERIKLRMKHVNCTRHEIARCCNVTERTVYNWCENKSIPELRHISSLCFIIQSHVPWVITGSIEQYQWVDEFPEGFLDFLHVIRAVPIENRGDVLRCVFDMVMNLHDYINNIKKNDKQSLINESIANSVALESSYQQVYKHEIQEKLTFSERFQLQQVHHNLSKKDIAIACDVSLKTVYNWSAGKCFPNIELLSRLCDVLDANLSWLVTGTCDIPQWLDMPQVEFKGILYQLNKLPVRVTSQIFRLTSLIVQELDYFVK